MFNFQLWRSHDKNRRKLEVTELASAIMWNTSAMKIVGVKLVYHSQMAYHVQNFTLILKLVRGSFHMQKCNLRPTSFPVAYFELWEK